MMFELILHHHYPSLSADDRSGHDNHGHVAGSPPVGQALTDELGLHFNGRDTRVTVLPGPTLEDLRAMRVTTTLWVEEVGQRQNIIEGYLSFALFIEADASLHAIVYDGTWWRGITSRPGVVPPREWVTVTFTYDRQDTSVLYLNNVLVASYVGYLGDVASIQWPFGLQIGAWPDGDSYMLKGKIREVTVWRAARSEPPRVW
jgi:hypothetical protein